MPASVTTAHPNCPLWPAVSWGSCGGGPEEEDEERGATAAVGAEKEGRAGVSMSGEGGGVSPDDVLSVSTWMGAGDREQGGPQWGGG